MARSYTSEIGKAITVFAGGLTLGLGLLGFVAITKIGNNASGITVGLVGTFVMFASLIGITLTGLVALFLRIANGLRR